MVKPLSDGRAHRRGEKVEAFVDGRWYPVVIVTHVRADLWLVEGSRLPARCVRPWSNRRPRRETVSEEEMRQRKAKEPR